MAACQRGLRVRYTTASQLVDELAEATDERMLTRVVGRYGRLDLLCLDELGYLQLDRRGAELLFQVLTEREERASVAVASNAPFSERGQTFAGPRLAATASPSAPTSSTPAASPTACASRGEVRLRPDHDRRGGARTHHHGGANWSCHSHAFSTEPSGWSGHCTGWVVQHQFLGDHLKRPCARCRRLTYGEPARARRPHGQALLLRSSLGVRS